ncbi:MAG: response regulator [Ignavibacteriae bacterium]|nr:response regulator [Ignavibacteriota bacterium]
MAKKILVVDDEPDVLTYLTTLFSDNGFDVMTANNGKECFDKARNEKPDLITLDITMPEESGVRAFKELQEDSLTENIPVIIITGITSEFKKFISTRKQVKPPLAYFEKPIDRDLLIAKVKELVGV